MTIAKAGPVGAAGEPLAAVDHVVVAVAHGGAGSWVGLLPGLCGLGHREAAADVAGEQRLQEAIVLLGGAVGVEDLHVAGVGGLAVEEIVAERGGAQDLADEAVVEQREAEAAEALRHLREPQAGGADLGAQAGEARLGGGEAHGEQLVLDRHEVFVEERAGAGEEELRGRGDREVHRGPSAG
jgi:hypothetical protein